ncbi:MAG: hypothetical protein LW602_08930 [Sediminibacterium sp.]|jgi:hypothetical protein|nr:hypothetical protein [Sediminibacterium sp.]
MKTNNGYSYSRAWFDYAFEHPEHVTASHGILYLWLVEINNRLGWVDIFQITASECMQGMGCKSYNTYKKCFDQLVEWGFVKVVKKAVNQHQCNIIALSKFDKALNKALDKALQKHLTKQSESTVQSNVEINCDIHKQVNHKPQTINNKRGVFTPPTENDIYNLMGELNMKSGGKWPESKIVSESKNCFDHYTSTGWKTTGGARIVSWEATIRKWMNNAFKFEQNQKSNTYGKPTTTADHIAKAEQLFRDAVAISHARDKARQDSGTTEA